MTNPTSNFGWQMPTSTDLVTDLPADFETFGQAVDTSLADLKGGTTGQVLSKASNTDMDFTWVAQDDSNAIQNAIVDAKGDLIAATAADTPARLAVGNDGETLVADSSTATGLKWAAPSTGAESLGFTAGKNKFINGDFSVNQRNFSTAGGNVGYALFDRYRAGATGGTVTWTNSTFTPGTAPVSGYEGKSYLTIQTSGQSAAADNTTIEQRIESVRNFAGQTATISFWAKAASGTPKIALEIIQNFGTGGSPSAQVLIAAGAPTLSTSWARYSITYAIPSISGKTFGTNNNDYLRLQFFTSAGSDLNARASSIGIQNNTIDLWGLQIEAGSTATSFQTATGTIQGELAACQRYYTRYVSGNLYGIMGSGIASNTGSLQVFFPFSVPMRTIPTALDSSAVGTFYWEGGSSSGNTPTNVTIGGSISASVGQALVNKTSGFTTGAAYALYGYNTTSAYVGFSAEL